MKLCGISAEKTILIGGADAMPGGIHMNFGLVDSMMCANYGCLEQEVKKLEEGGIDSFHIDIMDGRYVVIIYTAALYENFPRPSHDPQ